MVKKNQTLRTQCVTQGPTACKCFLQVTEGGRKLVPLSSRLEVLYNLLPGIFELWVCGSKSVRLPC